MGRRAGFIAGAEWSELCLCQLVDGVEAGRLAGHCATSLFSFTFQ